MKTDSAAEFKSRALGTANGSAGLIVLRSMGSGQLIMQLRSM